ncbi:MAG: ABC transporter ATP-binding protein [Fastidiosipilaceae bacterium]|mgnify:FL=1|jgi:peptide/nickel transport system ATP-binding protein|nr:ABC transporter ATP-binding protein [Clostridiaceae bacterium]
MSHLLSIKDLEVTFRTAEGTGYAVTDVSADLKPHQITTILGESGSGKSVLGSAIVQLLAPNASAKGSIRFQDRELTTLSAKEMDRIRGTEIGWVAQNPQSALNSVFQIGTLIAEGPIHHKYITKNEKPTFVRKILTSLRLPEKLDKQYSFELSGGMAQRVLIASGSGMVPPLLILDEPTKGLDDNNVAAVKRIIEDLAARGSTPLVITHDVDLAEELADEIWIFYGSQLVEQAPKEAFFKQPLHPYSKGLIDATPKRGLVPIPGESPAFNTRPVRCTYYPRCPAALEICRNQACPTVTLDNRRVKCLRY